VERLNLSFAKTLAIYKITSLYTFFNPPVFDVNSSMWSSDRCAART
jgi:hypothetical protein